MYMCSEQDGKEEKKKKEDGLSESYSMLFNSLCEFISRVVGLV